MAGESTFEVEVYGAGVAVTVCELALAWTDCPCWVYCVV